MKLVILGKDKDGIEVRITIVDLDTFVHAPPNANICVEDEEGRSRMVLKGELTDLEVE